MTIPEDGIYDVDAARRSRRRKQAVVGAAGLAALLGGGAFLLAETLDGGLLAGDAVAPVPAVASATSPSVPATAASRQTSAQPRRPVVDRQGASPSPSRALTPAERAATVKAKAAKAGVVVERPLVPQPLPGASGPVTVSNTGSLAAGGTLRVVSAAYDLTGQRELLWAADGGTAVGQARCTQNFRFVNNGKPRVRPSMLLCWRTSATRSVITVAVAKQGRPSPARSVAAIEAAWAKLG